MKKVLSCITAAVLAATLSVGLAACNTAEEETLSYTDKALAVIGSFASGDTQPVLDYMAEDYIQHNPDYATGRDAFIESVEGLAAAPAQTTVENIRAFEDGNYVFLQTV